MRSSDSDCPTLCIPPLLRGCGKINGPNVLMDPGGTYDPDFLAIHKDRGKRSKGYNSPVDMMVVNDHGSSDRISSIDSLLIPTLLLQNLKRVIPLHIGLLRLARSSPFSGFLVNLSKKGVSVKRYNLGHSWKPTKGNKLQRMDWKSDLVQLMHNQIHLST
jgi:hypothetical protein